MKFLLLSALLVLASWGAAYAEEDSQIKFNVGGGVSLLSNTIDQQFTYYGTSIEDKFEAGSVGFNGFLDITPYFTVNWGFRGAMGQINATSSGGGASQTSTVGNSVSQIEIGVEGKYPFQINKIISLAPKAGLDYVGYLGGTIGSWDVSSSSDYKQLCSPLYVTLGADVDFTVADHWFVRVPLDLGIALNAKLSSAYYYNAYVSSTNIAFRGGLEVGYSL